MLKFNFCERMLRAYAAVMRCLFPTYCVKSLTCWFPKGQGWYSLGAKERCELFLPGVRKEVRAIKKLGLTEEQLRRRVWSPETCEELLEQGDTSLWFLAKSDKAYDLVVATGDAKLISEVFNQNTPSVEYLKNWLANANRAVVMEVIKEKPSIFNDLKFNDLEREYVLELVNSSEFVVAERWAKRVFEVFADCSFTKQAMSEAHTLFDRAMQVLLSPKCDYNFTEYLDKLERKHWDWYEKVRAKADQSSHLVSYLLERLPNIWFRGRFDNLESFDESFRGENWGNVVDARRWLKLAYEHIYEPEVAKKALDVITDLTYAYPCEAIRKMQDALVNGTIKDGKVLCALKEYSLVKYAMKRLPEQYKSKLQSKLYEAVCSYAEAREALKILPKSYRKGLRAKLVKCTCTSDSKELLRTYWPFTSWEEETAEKAVRKLAEFKALPMDKLGELTKELQEAGLEELEIQSEMAAIGRAYAGEQQKKLMGQKFHARSESYLFQLDCNWQDLKQLYILSNEMEEESFRVLVHFRGTGYAGDEGCIKDLIVQHAVTWKLTEREYNDLMQSPYSPLAADLKKYLKNADEGTVEEPVEGIGKV